MMMVRRRVIAGFLALSFAFGLVEPSAANWAFTEWNMSPEQVKKASPEPLEPPSEIEHRLRSRGGMELLLSGPYRMGAFEFDAAFMFDEQKRLQRVVLDLRNMDQCEALEAAITRNYGQSSIDRSEGSMISREYQDEEHANVVGFYAISRLNTCRLSYTYTLAYSKLAR